MKPHDTMLHVLYFDKIIRWVQEVDLLRLYRISKFSNYGSWGKPLTKMRITEKLLYDANPLGMIL